MTTSLRAKLAICIPTVDGKISAWTVASVLGLYPPTSYLERLREIGDDSTSPAGGEALTLWDKLLPFDIHDTWMWDRGVVVVRGRAVRKFLESDATHLFFVDADVSFAPIVVRRLIALDRPIVGVPYPKRHIHWERVYSAVQAGKLPEEGAYDYVLHTGGKPSDVDADGCLDVEGLGMGCTLIRRDCLTTMVRAYGEDAPEREDLRFFDTHPAPGMGGPTVQLFAHAPDVVDGQDVLLSEDLSFCKRWRALGGKIACYLGEGAPAGHHGSHHFHGTREGLVAAHGEKKPDA